MLKKLKNKIARLCANYKRRRELDHLMDELTYELMLMCVERIKKIRGGGGCSNSLMERVKVGETVELPYGSVVRRVRAKRKCRKGQLVTEGDVEIP